MECAFASARSVRQERALDESRINLRIWRSVDVNIRLGFLLLRGWVYDCGVTLFLVSRRIDSRCLLLARGEQP